MQTFKKKMTVNGFTARYPAVLDSADGNRLISFFPWGRVAASRKNTMKFEFCVNEIPPPSGFDLGHMTVRGNAGTVSSRGHTPDQAMMIHLSLSALLDGLARLIVERQRSYAFGAVDSSFALHFTMKKDGTLVTRAGGRTGTVIDTSDPRGVTSALAEAAADFARRHLPTLPDDGGAQDLKASVDQYLGVFG